MFSNMGLVKEILFITWSTMLIKIYLYNHVKNVMMCD